MNKLWIVLILTVGNIHSATSTNPMVLEQIKEIYRPAQLSLMRAEQNQWRKLKFLCDVSSWGPRSLNPSCYQLVEWESRWNPPDGPQDFVSWWTDQCSERIFELNFQQLEDVSVERLPRACQNAWRDRREELIYRFSQDDVELLFQERRTMDR